MWLRATFSLLLAEDRVVGTGFGETFPDRALDGLIGLGDGRAVWLRADGEVERTEAREGDPRRLGGVRARAREVGVYGRYPPSRRPCALP